jgi:hypothetical protein
MSYDIEKNTKSDGQILNYWVRHIPTNTYVATCFDEDNTRMVCDALNGIVQHGVVTINLENILGTADVRYEIVQAELKKFLTRVINNIDQITQ